MTEPARGRDSCLWMQSRVRRESPSGGNWCCHAWNTASHWCTPFSGNAGMHIEPTLTEHLGPGASVSIVGGAGLFCGSKIGVVDYPRGVF